MGHLHGNFRNTVAHHQSRQPSALTPERERVMQQLGLNPDTPVDGLQTIFRCASNTTALRPRKLEALLRAQQG